MFGHGEGNKSVLINKCYNVYRSKSNNSLIEMILLKYTKKMDNTKHLLQINHIS